MKDAWGRTIEYVRLSLTDACNFCCPYCRPAEITPQSLSLIHILFVIGEAFFATGVAVGVGNVVHKFAKTETSLLVAVMMITGVLSGFLSNTGTAAVLIPEMCIRDRSSCKNKWLALVNHKLQLRFKANIIVVIILFHKVRSVLPAPL